LFGPCPYPVLNVIYSEGVTPGGHSPPGMIVLSRRSLRLRRLAPGDPGDFSDFEDFFLAHELAHQWWGHGVAPANYRERWLSEGFAQYAAALWIQQARSAKTFGQVLKRMAHWAERESHRGPINLGQRLGQMIERPAVYRAVVYDKGALVLHMIRGLLGDGPFFEGLRRLQTSRRFQLSLTGDLARAWEAASGRDLGPYLQSWIRDTPLPTFRWDHETLAGPTSWRTTVHIAAENLPGPLPLEISLELPNALEIQRVVVPPEGGVYAFETNAPPRRVRLNEDNGLLARLKPKR
jgi:aminopeptidase N